MTYRIADICAGLGVFHEAMKSTHESECVFASELDPRLCDLYEHNHGIRPAGDFFAINPRDIPDHDIMFAGIPCVSYSTRGNRQGLNDPRGQLVFSVIEALRVKRPEFIVIENVQQMLTHDRGNAWKTISTELQNLGYTLNWRILSPHQFGVPQIRRRVFVIGWLNGTNKLPEIPSTPCPNLMNWLTEPDDAKRLTGNYAKAIDLWTQVLAGKSWEVGHKLRIEDFGINPDLPKSYKTLLPLTTEPPEWNLFEIPSHGLEMYSSSVCGTIRANGYTPAVPKRGRHISNRECSRLMSLPFNMVEPLPRTAQKHALGNAINLTVARAVVECIGHFAPPTNRFLIEEDF